MKTKGREQVGSIPSNRKELKWHAFRDGATRPFQLLSSKLVIRRDGPELRVGASDREQPKQRNSMFLTST